MNSDDWDAKYERTDLIWGAPPNEILVELATSLPRGHALDLGCGEGRNALWLATRGWTVDAVDFSPVALTKARAVADTATKSIRQRLSWTVADVTQISSTARYDLALVLYLHLPSGQRRRVLQMAAEALKPEGILVILGHDATNLERGVGGPQDPEILYTTGDLEHDLAGSLVIETSEIRTRDTSSGIALDALVVARKRSIGSEGNPA